MRILFFGLFSASNFLSEVCFLTFDTSVFFSSVDVSFLISSSDATFSIACLGSGAMSIPIFFFIFSAILADFPFLSLK